LVQDRVESARGRNGGLHIADDMLDCKPPRSHVMGRSRKWRKEAV